MGDIVKDELEFYSKFTKPLIFNLPDAKDRVLAASWVKKIRDERVGPERLRTDYMKLLLFALQRRKLVGIFADDPSGYEQLEVFPPEFDLNDIAKKLIEKEYADRQERITRQIVGQIGDYPPYTTDCSSDFREYVAAQDIPGFGVHCYYAISREPVNKWQKADKGVFPKLARSAVDTTSPLPPGLVGASSEPTCTCPPAEGENESECKKRKEPKPPEPRKKHKKKLGKTPPVTPLGTVSAPEDRNRPTWGSNLVEVKDITQAHGEEEEEEDTNQQDLEEMGPLDAFGEVSLFMEEFKREALSKQSPKKPSMLKKGRSSKVARSKQKEGAAGTSAKPLFVASTFRKDEDEDLEEGEDLEKSVHDESIKEDSQLMDYLKDQINRSVTQKKITVVSQNVKETPAHAGIPLTTPRPSPNPKRPTSTERLVRDDVVEPPLKPEAGEVDVDALDDDELAEMGITREEAKQLFATDVFKLPGDEEFADDLEKSMESDGELEPAAEEDAEWLEWEKRMKALEEEAERELLELQDEGLDLDTSPKEEELDILQAEDLADAEDYVVLPEEEMIQYDGRMISKDLYDFFMSAPDLPPKSPQEALQEVAAVLPPALPDVASAQPGKKGKSTKTGKPRRPKSGIAKPSRAKPGAAIPPEATEDKVSRLSKPDQAQSSKSKIQPPGAKKPLSLQAKEEEKGAPSKMRQPGSKLRPPGSKLKPPGVSEPQPPEEPAEVVPATAVSPVKKGSPEAGPVLSAYQRMMKLRDKVAGVIEEAEPEYPEGVERTPPVFSKYGRVREAADGLVYGPEEFGIQEGDIEWQPATDFFAKQTEFVPFDPRQHAEVQDIFPQLDDRQYGDEMFFDFQGEPNFFDEAAYIDEMDIPPSPLSESDKRFKDLELYAGLDERLEEEAPCIACSPPALPPSDVTSPRKAKTPPQLPSWEFGLPASVRLADLSPLPEAFPTKTPPIKQLPRQVTPPSGLREHFTPPLRASPRREPPTVPLPFPPPWIQPPRSAPLPPRVRSPQGVLSPPKKKSPKRGRSPRRSKTPPKEVSPPKGASTENMFTCEACSPDLAGILENVSPDRFLTAQGLGVSPQFIFERSPPEDIFGIEGLDRLDVSPPALMEEEMALLKESSPCGPCARPPPRKLSPIERAKQEVGYSVAELQPIQLPPLSSRLADYKSPEKKKLTQANRKNLKKQEQEYINFLFSDDKDTHDTIQKALELVADVEQEEADPYHLMPVIPASPPWPYQAGEGGVVLSDVSLDYEQLPASPVLEAAAAAGKPAVSQLPQLGKRTGAMPRSGLPKPGTRPSGIVPPGARARPPSGIQPPGTKVRSGIAIPGGIRPPAESGTSGIPAPGRSGIPAPGRSGIPAPGKSGIPAPGGSGITKTGRSIPMIQRAQPAAAKGTCQGSCGSGIARLPSGATADAGKARRARSGIAQPTQKKTSPKRTRTPTAEDMRVAEFLHRAPDRGPPGAAYLPQQPAAFTDYPPMRSGFKEAIQRHQIDQVFFEPHRPLMQARSVVTGKTSAKRKKIDRISSAQMSPTRPPVQLLSDLYRRHYGIEEVPEETPLSPKKYGVPGIQVPARPAYPTTSFPTPLPPDMFRPSQSRIAKPSKQRKSRLPGPRQAQLQKSSPQPLPPAEKSPSKRGCLLTHLAGKVVGGVVSAFLPPPPPPPLFCPPSFGPPMVVAPPYPPPMYRPPMYPPPIYPPPMYPPAPTTTVVYPPAPPTSVMYPPAPPTTGRPQMPSTGEVCPPTTGMMPMYPSATQTMIIGYPPAYPVARTRKVSPPPTTAAGEEFDMEELRQYGLTEADLQPINVDLNVSDVSDVPEEAVDDEYVPDAIDTSFERWEEKMRLLEAENAEDIALYGHLPLDEEQPKEGSCSCTESPRQKSPKKKSPTKRKLSSRRVAGSADQGKYSDIPASQMSEVDAILQRYDAAQAAAQQMVMQPVPSEQIETAQAQPWVPPVPMIPIETINEAISLRKKYPDMDPQNLEFLLGAGHTGEAMIPVHRIPDAERLMRCHGQIDPQKLLHLLDNEAIVGRQTSKGYIPPGAKKVQYPKQIRGRTPPTSPTETPSPVLVPRLPPKPPSPADKRFAGFLRGPRAGPSRFQKAEAKYSPPPYDSPHDGVLEESPPLLPEQEHWMEMRKGGAVALKPAPQRQVRALRPPSGPCQTCETEYVPTPKQRKKHRKRDQIPRKKIEFDYMGKETDISDALLKQIMDRYDLPPLPAQQSPARSPPLYNPQLMEWKTPEEIKKMVPKPKKPSPRPDRTYVIPEMKPHQYFIKSPAGPISLDQSILGESPQMELTPPPLSPRSPRRLPPPHRLPPPRKLFSPEPEMFDQKSPLEQSPDMVEDVCSPCTPPPLSPALPGTVGDIFAEAGISPARLPPPTPPSPYSTQEAMHQMLSSVRAAKGRQGIVRKPIQVKRRRRKDFKPMRPITEVVTQPGIGRMGLPEVVQVDMETLGTGQRGEETYGVSAYVPPPRPVPGAVAEEEEEMVEEDMVDDVYGEFAIHIPEEDLQEMRLTSPLPQLVPAQVSPPRVSPRLPNVPIGGSALDQTAPNFEDLEAFDRYSTTPIRIPQVTPKPSPMLTPCSSYTPCRLNLSPQLPQQRLNEAILSDYSPDSVFTDSPEQFSPQRRTPSPSPRISPRYISPEWLQTSAVVAESSGEQEVDEMGLPPLVDLYAQHMAPIYSSPTERRERPITRTDEGENLTFIRPQAIYTRQDIQLDNIPVDTEQVEVEVPITKLSPFVPGSLTLSPPYNFSPSLPQYEGAQIQDEDIDLNAVYTGEYGNITEYEAETPPSVGGTPSPQRSISPRTPTPKGALSLQRTVEMWDRLIDETAQTYQLETSIQYPSSPEDEACAPCSANSDRTYSTSPLSPTNISPTGTPRGTPHSLVEQPAVGSRSLRLTTPAGSPQVLSRSQIAAQFPARTPLKMSPIVMPELSPFRMPQPSPETMYGPLSESATAEEELESSRKKSVSHTMTTKKIVTVIPPRPTIPLEWEGQMVKPFREESKVEETGEGGADKNNDKSFNWIDQEWYTYK